MAQKLRKTALMFGQVAGAPPDQEKPTLSGFYGGVGAGQVGAVQQVGEGVRTETSKLPTTFGGVTETKDETGKVTGYKLGAGEAGAPFRATVARETDPTKPLGSTDVIATVDDQGNITYKDKAGKVVEGTNAAKVGEVSTTAAANVGALQTAQTKEEAALQEASTKASQAAGETLKEQQARLTEGKLGVRREASELEKQAKDYRNVLIDTPGTTNVGAVASLMSRYNPATGKMASFYDIKKYGGLESGLRQGEISLARQQAGGIEAGMETAEGARTGAIEEFKGATQENYDKLTKAIEQDKQDKLKSIKDYYAKQIKTQQDTAQTARDKEIELAKVEKEAKAKKEEVADKERVGVENELFGEPFAEDPSKTVGVLPKLTSQLRDSIQFAKDRIDNLNKTPRIFKRKGHTKELQSHELIRDKGQAILDRLDTLDRLATKARIDKNVETMRSYINEVNDLKKQFEKIRQESIQLNVESQK